jgi:AAA domain
LKINRLVISNFRGISLLEADQLGDTIIIAGQNGSGKSCLFDAIRLLKSTYGGYQQNEWQHFFGEFAIQLHGNSANLSGLFNDRTKSVTIEADFQLRDREKAFISQNAAELLEEAIWQTLLPEAFQWGGYQKALFANQFRERQPEVTARGLMGPRCACSVIGRPARRLAARNRFHKIQTSHFDLPRLRALALFGRRPSGRGNSLGMPASENLHSTRDPNAITVSQHLYRRASQNFSERRLGLAIQPPM